jgi:glycosyltransferase involved in cell wall biosynthesis
MRILIGATSIFKMGGMQRITIALANHLVEGGHQVILVGEKRKHSKIYYPCNSDVDVKNIRTYFKKYRNNYLQKILLHKCLASFQFIFKLPLEKFSWYNHNAWQARYSFRVDAWRELCLQEKPDIVIGVLPDTFTILSIALQDTNIPLIINNHNDPWKDYSATRWNSNPVDIEKRLMAPELAAANTVLLPSFKNFFSPRVQLRTYVTPNPVEPIDASQRATPAETEGMKTIIATGRFEPVKDHATLIRAFAKLHQQFPDWQVKIFGHGSLKKMLSALIKELGLTQQVFLCPHTDDINQEYRASHILAMPSLFEGWGLSLTEAMAHGLPSLGFDDATGINSLILHDQTGFLADGKNRVESFAHYLCLLMQNEKMRKKMGAAAVSFVSQYSPEKVYSLWDNMLGEVIRKNKAN